VTARRLLIYLWTLPTTCVGLPPLLLALLTRRPPDGAPVRRVEGVLEVHSPAVAWLLEHLVPLPGGASAMTLGHIVIARDAATLQRTRAHERVHVRQAERWGPLFIPAYFAAALYVRLRGGDAYRDNPFEREAFASQRRPGAEKAR